MKKTRPRIFLVDGMAIAYRAYFAFIQRPLMTSDGRNVSAIYGFVTFLNAILTGESPDYLIVAFDTPEPTFRHKQFKEYKATRQKMPEDMSSQIGPLKEVVKAYRIPLLEMPGFEADDIIGTLARKAEKQGLETFVVTSDKDFMQLVSKDITLYRPGKAGGDAEEVSYLGVKEKFGVTPDKVIEVLALTGDASDNVPGVPGIGEKTAIPLIQKYGSLEKLYAKLEEIPQKGVRAKLTEHKEKAFLSRDLVTIRTNAPVELDLASCKVGQPDPDLVRELFRSFEFRSLLAKLDGKPTQAAAQTKEEAAPVDTSDMATIATDRHTYHHVTTEKELKDLVKRLASAKGLVFDTETTSTDALRADLVGVSLAVEEREAWFVRIVPTGKGGSLFEGAQSTGIPSDVAVKILKPLLEDPSIAKAGHNIKYDMLVMSKYGVEVQGVAFDTMVASYLLRADAQHNMDAVSREYLKYSPVSYDELVGEGKNKRSILEVDPVALSDYSSEDADITLRLWHFLEQKLGEHGMKRLSEEVDMPLVPVLARMEKTGVCVDGAYLQVMSKDLEKQLQGLTSEIHKHAGGPFNINSTQQLGQVLFTKLGLPTVRKTKTGFSTDVSLLETLRNAHPIVEKMLEYRQLSKLKSTYVDALPTMVHPETGRVHTSFSQAVAATGRLASSDPNLQNIPIRTEAGRAVRKAFIASNNRSAILSADYSQIELRVMAHIAGDEGLSEAFRNKEDIHASTAARVFGVKLKDVDKEMRRRAKEVNFGIMYGIGPFGLANRLELSQSEAKEIIEKYFQRFPKVQQYISDTKASAKEKGYVQTLLGRRRYLPDLRSQNRTIQQNAERQAINMPIQGTAADMIKIAMVRIDAVFRKQKLQSSMIMQVHDELVFEIQKSEETKVSAIVEKEMVDALPLSVPMEVEIGVGPNWLDAH